MNNEQKKTISPSQVLMITNRKLLINKFILNETSIVDGK